MTDVSQTECSRREFIQRAAAAGATGRCGPEVGGRWLAHQGAGGDRYTQHNNFSQICLPNTGEAAPGLWAASGSTQGLGWRAAISRTSAEIFERNEEENRRPKASTVCEHCPNSVWFASPAEVKCYCRVMFLVTWSSKEPNQITHCDGEFLGQEQE